jgi:hypothetical protein
MTIELIDGTGECTTPAGGWQPKDHGRENVD